MFRFKSYYSIVWDFLNLETERFRQVFDCFLAYLDTYSPMIKKNNITCNHLCSGYCKSSISGYGKCNSVSKLTVLCSKFSGISKELRVKYCIQLDN